MRRRWSMMSSALEHAWLHGSIAVIVSAVDAATQKAQIAYDGSGITVKFWGIPGVSYVVERSPTGTDSWSYQATVMASTNAPTTGQIIHTDASPLSPSGFYRLKP